MQATVIESISLTSPSLEWLIVVGAFSVLFSLVLAWLATLIIYAKIDSLKKIFPATHNIIRAHIDYLMMTSLLGFFYGCYKYFGLTMPPEIIVILCFGVLYNPFGFILKAINPKIGNSDTLIGKVMVCVGFLPTTIGFGYASAQIMMALL